MIDKLRTQLETTRNELAPPATASIAAARMAMVTLLSTVLMTVPVWAQVGSAEEARNLEGIGVLQAFVYLLMVVVPIIALIVLLASFVMLSATKNPKKKQDYKEWRNSAVLYGLIITPALGTIIGLLGELTGNPVLESLGI